MGESAADIKYDFSELAKELLDGSANEPEKILFVCTGNTCRSPMAEAVLNALGKGKYKAFSAGISVIAGDVISENAVKALEKKGIESTEDNNYKAHVAKQIEEKDIETCDRMVAISKAHMLRLIYAFPSFAEKITVMKNDIPDPFMLGEAEYESCLDEIISCIKEMFLV
jgi:protein-tyrosine phosphatase